jgi:hypothetical protein
LSHRSIFPLALGEQQLQRGGAYCGRVPPWLLIISNLLL